MLMAIKVIQWATGEVGRAQLQEIIQHPDFELVGLFVYDPKKAGKDAGTLCGLPPTGVKATSDKDAIFAMKADVVCHAATKYGPYDSNAEDIERLLASGKNVVTTTTYGHLPTYGHGVQERFEAACRKGNSSFLSAGELPGFMMQRLATTLGALSKRIDHVIVEEYFLTDWMTSASMVFDGMLMGRPPKEVTLDAPGHVKNDLQYKQEIGATAQIMGIKLEKIERSLELATVNHDIVIPAGTLKAGTVVGQKIMWDGYWKGKPYLTIREFWIMTRDIPQWNFDKLVSWKHKDYWRFIIEGLPRLELDLDLSMQTDDPTMQETGPCHLIIAMSGVRALRDVCKAPPGIIQAPIFAAYRPVGADG